jgi:uncharacterized membrane-anchored protein
MRFRASVLPVVAGRDVGAARRGKYVDLNPVGLFGYLVKAAHDSGRMMIEPSIVTAAFVQIAALAIWWTLRRIRNKNIAGED